MAFANTLLCAVVSGPVERMGHCPDELPHRVAWQLRVRIESNDVSNAFQNRCISDDMGKLIARLAAQE